MEWVGPSAKCCRRTKPRVVDHEARNPFKLIQKTGCNMRASTLFVKVHGIGDILAGTSVHGSFHAFNRARS
jgi:hypothetical protein